MQNDGIDLKTCGRQRMLDMVDPTNPEAMMAETRELSLDSRITTSLVEDQIHITHIRDTKASFSRTEDRKLVYGVEFRGFFLFEQFS